MPSSAPSSLLEGELAFRGARKWRDIGSLFLVWTGLAMLNGVQNHLSNEGSTGLGDFLGSLLWALRPSYTFALLSLPIIWLTRRLESTPPARAVIIHLAAGIACTAIQCAVRASIAYTFPHLAGGMGFEETFWWAFGRLIFLYVVIYALIVVGIKALDAYARLAHERERSARLQIDAAQARLKALQAQLQPHFLFNTLNAISSLVAESPAKATDLIARLGELLRQSIDQAEQPEISLHDEIEFSERYLEIEQARLDERLSVRWKVDPRTRDLLVPPLLMQPLVENAIKHGVARSSDRGTVAIETRFAADGRLVIAVTNTGPRFAEVPADAEPGGRWHLALSNMRARLDSLYGPESFSFTLVPRRETGGACATLVLPARPDPESVEPAEALLQVANA